MSQLNEKQRKFCEVYVQNGGDGAAAARTAGYKDSPNIRITACKTLQQPHIQAEIEKQIRVQMSQHGPVALKRIKELMEHDDPRIALKASMDFADRAGLKPTEKKELTIVDERTDEEVEASITAAIAELGIESDSIH